jgi:hypothetical protein
MKRNSVTGIAAFAAALLLVLASCAGAPAVRGTGEGSASPVPQPAKTIERIRLDYKGAAIGADIPDWVEWAIDNDYDAITRLSRFRGRVPIINYAQGKNLDLLRSWVNNFNIQAQVSRQIVNYVEANFGGAQLGTKDSPENQQFLKEVVGTFSNTTINGLSQDLDYWILLRTVDHTKETETELYNYYVVYSIAEEDLNYQIAQAMGKVTAKNAEQQEIKLDVEEAMKKAAFKGILPGE